MTWEKQPTILLESLALAEAPSAGSLPEVQIPVLGEWFAHWLLCFVTLFAILFEGSLCLFKRYALSKSTNLSFSSDSKQQAASYFKYLWHRIALIPSFNLLTVFFF